MAGLQNAFAHFGTCQQIVGLVKRCSQRLLDKQVQACIQERRRHSVVVHGGNGNGGRIELKIGGEQLIHRRKHGNVVFRSRIDCAGRVRLDGCHQNNTQAGGFQLTIDAEMVAAKSACPGNGNSKDGLASYFVTPGAGSLPPTALRQRL